ncbi:MULTISPECIES: hypothetical protein [unclassified Streptomyces]|uniref:hypothetical protein n=1 Tax=unclassified Streptomyces TaxID=2593676 RepID=UPI003FCFF42B
MRTVSLRQRLRAWLSRAFYGENSQIRKPTAEEYRAITRGRGRGWRDRGHG